MDDDPTLIRVITTPKRDMGGATLEMLGSFAGQARVSLFEATMMGGIKAQLAPRQLELLHVLYEFIVRLPDRAAKEPVATLLDKMMENIHYETYLYDTYDERQAQNK